MGNDNASEKPLRILHIEDSKYDAEIIRDRLNGFDKAIQIDWASNEREFTAFLIKGGYDIILADYQLPGFNAPAALKLTRSLFPVIPFICVSGAIGEENAVELLKLGATDYVLKDRLEKLTLALQRALDEVREREARRLAEENILRSLHEKETLIRELYHRTKNTIQVIRGFLLLQAEEFPANEELQKLVKNTESRIQAISLVHQMLYKTQDLSQISVEKYVGELSASIIQSFCLSADKIAVDLKIDDQYFLMDTAIPFGLILNELMTNSLKHAFDGNKKALITITLTRNGQNKNLLRYSDNGIGVADGFDFRNQNTLGLKLIYGIGEKQMLGKVTMENKNGVSCSFEFPNNLYKKRV